MRRAFIVFVFLMSIYFPGSIAADGSPYRQLLSLADLENAAVSILLGEGVEPDAYYISTISFNEEDSAWRIVYMSNQRYVGGHFLLEICDKNPERYKLIPGI